MAELQFQIDGMHCGACVQRVTRVLEPAWTRYESAPPASNADSPSADRYLAAIRKAGFEAHLVE
jgi:copper chaperone CopZ